MDPRTIELIAIGAGVVEATLGFAVAELGAFESVASELGSGEATSARLF